MAFIKAQRCKTKLRLAITAPSGGGKTHTALLLANGLAEGCSIVVIDSERGKALLEAGKVNIPEFLHDNIYPPYSPDKYISMILEGAKVCGPNGVLIVDSISHEWAGEGGILDLHGVAADKQSFDNSWAAWRTVTPKQNAFIDTLLGVNCHVIVTMRSKTEWDVQTNSKGKKEPVKIGLAPIQKKDIEYEFTTTISLNQKSHVADCIRDSTGIFDGKVFVPTVETGRELLSWLNEGVERKQTEYVPKAIKSKQILDRLIIEAESFSTSSDLEAWGAASKAAFEEMEEEDKERVKTYCRNLLNKMIEDEGAGK